MNQPGRIENEHKAFYDMVDRYTGNEKTILLLTTDMNHTTFWRM